MSEAPFPVTPARRRQPRLGYLMAATAAVLWGVNGAVSKTILVAGLSSERLAQIRSGGAALAIGVALLIEYLAPLLVALWARFFYKATVRRRIWVALALALTGLALIVNVFGGGTSLSTAGVLYALAGSFAYATYVLLAEHVVGNRDPVSLLAWGFLFASVFWAVLDPWWSFPGHLLTSTTSLH